MNKASPRMAAVIDVGSNSIRYMEAAVAPEGVTAFLKRLCTTRLATALDDTGMLGEPPMQRSLDAIVEFAALAQEKGLPVYAYATSAVRDAQNGAAFCARVQDACGVTLRVLSGQEEALLAYRGAVGKRGGGLIDIGGGSAQVMLPDGAQSWPIGCVRAREIAAGLDYSAARERIAQWMAARGCAGLSRRADAWTGVGGTLTTLGALQLGLTQYDPARMREAVIAPAGLDALLRWLWDMGAQRAAHPLLHERHDVICYGGMVAAELMAQLCIARLCISDADGMEGFLLKMV